MQDTGDDDQGDNDGDNDDEDEDGPAMPECFADLTSENITFYAHILKWEDRSWLLVTVLTRELLESPSVDSGRLDKTYEPLPVQMTLTHVICHVMNLSKCQSVFA